MRACTRTAMHRKKTYQNMQTAHACAHSGTCMGLLHHRGLHKATSWQRPNAGNRTRPNDVPGARSRAGGRSRNPPAVGTGTARHADPRPSHATWPAVHVRMRGSCRCVLTVPLRVRLCSSFYAASARLSSSSHCTATAGGAPQSAGPSLALFLCTTHSRSVSSTALSIPRFSPTLHSQCWTII